MRLVVKAEDVPALPGRFEVRVTVKGEDTGGVMSVVEETLPPHSLITPHVHQNDVWVYVLEGTIGVLVGDELATAGAGTWALKPRSIMHAMWNAESASARILEVLTPAGTERWFEEVAALAPDDDEGFKDACERHGIRFLPESPWAATLRQRFSLD